MLKAIDQFTKDDILFIQRITACAVFYGITMVQDESGVKIYHSEKPRKKKRKEKGNKVEKREIRSSNNVLNFGSFSTYWFGKERQSKKAINDYKQGQIKIKIRDISALLEKHAIEENIKDLSFLSHSTNYDKILHFATLTCPGFVDQMNAALNNHPRNE